MQVCSVIKLDLSVFFACVTPHKLNVDSEPLEILEQMALLHI